jgi:myo-inositol 2-dehydrogenase/D-chiro-inositol 1-dehydrogenase
MNHQRSSGRPGRMSIDRRGFLGGVGLTAAGMTAGHTAAYGVHAAGDDRLRIGVIGCGGRGTGAALQAARVDRDVVIGGLADLFTDHLESSATLLETRLGPRGICPADRRFVGPDAWQRLLDTDIDLVILAAHPATRPDHCAAAVATGTHIYMEAPCAIDVEGVRQTADALAAAAGRGLVVVAGLGSRHDAATRQLMAKIQDDATTAAGIGRPLHASAVHLLGTPWVRPRPSGGWTPAEERLRNWVSDPALSGGCLVEKHVHAIDRAFWALGDDDPIRVVPVGREPPGAASSSHAAVRYEFADGRSIDVAIDRRSHGPTRRVEYVAGSHGRLDLTPLFTGRQGSPPPLEAAMERLIRSVRAGACTAAADSARSVCRSTLAAILGRTAAETGRPVAWPELSLPG